ncbi:MAG: hypothetical protein K0U78_21260 [Actinomycetia bacterium]|nr:hypothetical protein [Actinomycetes bacterium]
MNTSNDPWWGYARGCARALTADREPPKLPVHGPLLEPNETVRLNSPATYSRLYAGDGSYERAQAPFLMNPLLMGAAMAGQSAVNRSRRREADRDTQPNWRNHREASVLTTNQRLMCSRPQGGWLSFWYQDLAEYHPDLAARTLTMSFHDDHTPPLQLSGPATPGIALWTAYALYGDKWRNDPRLAALTQPDRSRETASSTPDLAAGTDRRSAIPPGLTQAHYDAWCAQEEKRQARPTRAVDGFGLSR